MIWRTEDGMEYLDITFKPNQEMKNIHRLRKVHSYPVIVIIEDRSNKLINSLRDYQLKVDVRSKSDPE
jgi:hypothetical protein